MEKDASERCGDRGEEGKEGEERRAGKKGGGEGGRVLGKGGGQGKGGCLVKGFTRKQTEEKEESGDGQESKTDMQGKRGGTQRFSKVCVNAW